MGTRVGIGCYVAGAVVLVAQLIFLTVHKGEGRFEVSVGMLAVFAALLVVGIIASVIGGRGPEDTRRRQEARPVLDPTNDPSWPPVMTGRYRPIDKPARRQPPQST